MATGSITTLGIASSLDLQGIIDGLKEADEITITNMRQDVTDLKATQDEFNVINAKLLEMKASALSLSLSSNWLKRTSSVSSEVISATVADGTKTGNYGVEVERLASQSSFISNGFESETVSIHSPTTQQSVDGFDNTTDIVLAEDDAMTITYGSGETAVTISITGGAGGESLDDLVTAINTAAENDDGSGGTHVTASTYEDDDGKHHLQITATSGGTGTDNKVMVTESPDLMEKSFLGDSTTFSYKLGNETEIDLTVPANTTLSSLVSRINEDPNNPGVTASLVDTGIGSAPYKLVLKANDHGEDNRIVITSGLTEMTLTEENGSGYVMTSESTIDPDSYIILTADKGNQIVFQEDMGNGYSTDITATIEGDVFNDGEELAAAVEKAIEEASAASGNNLNYTVSWNSTSNKLEISEAGTLTNLNIKWEDSSAATALGFSANQVITPAASSLNAAVTVDGVSYQRQANSGLTDLISGITLGFSDVGSSTITVGQETESLMESITSLVTIFSDISKEIDSNDDYEYDKDTEVSTWGTLTKSPSIHSMESALNSALGATINTGGDITSLYDLGFEIDDKGNITIDETVLSEAISSNFDAVRDFFLGTDDTDGLADSLNDHLLNLTITGGYIDSETSGIDDKIKALETSIERQQEVIEDRYETMTQTFVELSKYMRKMESMSSYVSQMFSATESKKE